MDNQTTTEQPEQEKTIQCDNCKKDIEQGDEMQHDDLDYCGDCYSELFFLCEICNKVYDNDDCQGSENGDFFCQDCYNDTFSRCYDCDNEMKQDNIGGTFNDNYLCVDCYQENYFNCYNCDNLFHNDDSNSSNNGDYYCNDCYQDQEQPEQQPELNKFCNISVNLETTKHIPISAEIEAENGEYKDAFDALTDLNIGAGVSKDGSLDDTGIEVQTSPALITKFNENVIKICLQLTKNNYQATKSTGLHIHIGLKGSTDTQILNIIKTISAIEPIIYSLTSQSRQNNTYCKPINQILPYHKIKDKTDIMPILRIYYAQGNKENKENYRKNKTDLKTNYKFEKYNQSRYYGLNIHSFFFRNTIEFRYHQGSTNAEKITNWAKFLLYIVNYARFSYQTQCLDYIIGIQDKQLQLKAILRIIKAPKHLTKYIIQRQAELLAKNQSNKNHELSDDDNQS